MNTFLIWKDLKSRAEGLAARGIPPEDIEFEAVVREVCRNFDPPDAVLAFYLAELRALTAQRVKQRAEQPKR